MYIERIHVYICKCKLCYSIITTYLNRPDNYVNCNYIITLLHKDVCVGQITISVLTKPTIIKP